MRERAGGLSLQSAGRMAIRELRAAKGKFLFVVLSVAIGVAALTGVRGFSAAFRNALLVRARAIMAADLSARMSQQPTPAESRGLLKLERQTGVRVTPVTEMLSMASNPRTMDPLLVSLKAVDPAQYPFYGKVELQPNGGTLAMYLKDDTVVVASDLLLRLHLAVGDSLRLGDKAFRIAAVVVNEPDRLTGSFAAGPRVLISQRGIEGTGLLAQGSRAGQRYLFKVSTRHADAAATDAEVAALKERLIELLPESQVIDYRETNPALTEGLDRATSLLSLMSLVALVLGAVGVAMAMRAHLAERMDTIAIMKSLGARSGQIVRIYLAQTVALGLLGGLLGVALGVAVQLVLPVLVAHLVHLDVALHLQWQAIVTGLVAGVVITVLFTLPPLLDIREVRPLLVLRRSVEDEDQGQSESGPRGPVGFMTNAVRRVWRDFRRRPAQWGAFLLIFVGLAVVATALSDSATVGRYFAVGLVAVLLALSVVSAMLLAGLRLLLARVRLRLPSTMRHGLANLYRPGNPSAALLAALGLGVMQITTVFLVQQAVVRELHISASPELPNVFLIDITPDEIDAVRTLVARQKVVQGKPEFLPVVSSRVLSVDGVPAAQLRLRNFPKRLLQSISVTWATKPFPGVTVVSGHWWTAEQAAAAGNAPLVALDEHVADRLHVNPGSKIVFAAQDAELTATVVAVTKSDGQHVFSRAEFVLPPAALEGLPAVWYGGVHAMPDRVDELIRTLYASYPTVTVINVAAALETIRQVVVQITYIVQFLAAFSIFAGAVILASSIAGTRYRRVREVVVLKTLGGTRGRIAGIFSIEFAVLGLVAAGVGVVFANLVAKGVLHKMEVQFVFHPLWNLEVLAGTAVLTVVTGWIASFRVLGQKPLEVLREE